MIEISKPKRAYIGLIFMTVIIGLSFIFVKKGLKHSSAIDLLAHRFTAGAIIIGILGIFGFLKFSALSWAKVGLLLLLSLFFPLLFFTFQTFGMEYSSASNAGIVFATIPIITLIIARIFLKERTTFVQKTGVFLSVLGIGYILFQAGNLSESTSLNGTLLLFLSVLSIVAYYTLGKKISLEFSTIEITFWMTILAFIIFNSWSIISHLQTDTLNDFFLPLINSEFVWSVLYLGILSSVLTSFLTVFALSVIPASQIAVFNNLSPIIAIVGGVLILDETLHTYQIIGGILVVLGVAMTQIFKRTKKS
jgi:drug/metabolite transporter (DMT)-like permease